MELAASVLGLVGVALMTREIRAGWLIAFVSAVLYALLWYSERFYAQMFLYLVFCGTQLYGWAHWGDSRKALPVARVGAHGATWLAAGVPLTGGVVFLLQLVGAAQPLADALITVYSLIAQLWMVYKFRECWLLFFVVDAGAATFYYTHGFRPTGMLFTAYLGLAALGWLSWREPPAESPDEPPP